MDCGSLGHSQGIWQSKISRKFPKPCLLPSTSLQVPTIRTSLGVSGLHYGSKILSLQKVYRSSSAAPPVLLLLCVQPLDMVKVRLQLSSKGARSTERPSPLTIVRGILSSGQVLDLYEGLSAALARHVVSGTSRPGLFVTFKASVLEG